MKPYRKSPHAILVHLPAQIGRSFVNYPTLSSLGPLLVADYLERSGVMVSFIEGLTERDPGRRDPITEMETGADSPPSRVLGWPPSPDRLLRLCRSSSLVVFCVDMFCWPRGAWGRWVRRLSKRVRDERPDVGVVVADCYVGGQDYIPLDPALLLEDQPAVDAYVRGESEIALRRLAFLLAEAGQKGTQIGRQTLERASEKDISGVWSRQDAGDPGLAEPDALRPFPFPAFHLMDMERFLVAQHRLAGADLIPEYRLPADSDRLPPALLPAVTSRGCPFSCLFCAGLSAYRHRAATAGEVRTHIERYENLAGRRRAVLFFLDDVMNLDIERFKEIESHLEASPLGWTPVNGLRADRLDAEAIEGFASSGGFNLKISAESGDDRVLEEIIGKRMKAAASIRAAKLAQQGRVSLLAHYVVGFPGETTAEMNRTLKLAASLHQDHGVEPRVQFATPVPGSRLAHLASSRGLLPVEIAREQLGNLFVSGPCFDTAELPAGAQRAAVAMFRHRIAQHGCPSLLLDPGFACNQRCTYCCVAHLRRRRLPPSTLHRAAVEARSRAVRRVDIGGGEPTLLDDLAGLISHLRGLGFDDVGLVTNGRRLCYPSYTKSLIRAGLDRFVISVSGHTEALSREITRVEGGLDQTLSGLEHLEALAPPNPPALNITVCRSNRHALADMVRFYTERFRLGAINLQVVLPLGSAVESPEVFCSYEEVAEQVGEAVRAAGEHVEAVPVRVHNLPFCFLPEALPALLPEAYKGGRLQLDSTGKLGDFSDVVGEALGHAEWCGSCPAVISCPGMQATLIDRYRNQRWRAERMAETIESTDVEGILFGGVS